MKKLVLLSIAGFMIGFFVHYHTYFRELESTLKEMQENGRPYSKDELFIIWENGYMHGRVTGLISGRLTENATLYSEAKFQEDSVRFMLMLPR